MQSSHFPKMELKYCERCGGLWIRPLGGEEVYCGKCAKAIEELPPVKRKAAPGDKKSSLPLPSGIGAAARAGGARA